MFRIDFGVGGSVAVGGAADALERCVGTEECCLGALAGCLGALDGHVAR
jgi:hypothetical protein